MKNVLLISTILLFGISVFFRKLSVNRIHPYQLQTLAGIIYTLFIPVWLFLISKTNNIGPINSSGIIYGIICVVTNIIGAILFGTLLKSSNDAGFIALMVSTNPIITAFLSALILDEQFGSKKILATIIMLVGFVLFNL